MTEEIKYEFMDFNKDVTLRNVYELVFEIEHGGAVSETRTELFTDGDFLSKLVPLLKCCKDTPVEEDHSIYAFHHDPERFKSMLNKCGFTTEKEHRDIIRFMELNIPTDCVLDNACYAQVTDVNVYWYDENGTKFKGEIREQR